MQTFKYISIGRYNKQELENSLPPHSQSSTQCCLPVSMPRVLSLISLRYLLRHLKSSGEIVIPELIWVNPVGPRSANGMHKGWYVHKGSVPYWGIDIATHYVPDSRPTCPTRGSRETFKQARGACFEEAMADCHAHAAYEGQEVRSSLSLCIAHPPRAYLSHTFPDHSLVGQLVGQPNRQSFRCQTLGGTSRFIVVRSGQRSLGISSHRISMR